MDDTAMVDTAAAPLRSTVVALLRADRSDAPASVAPEPLWRELVGQVLRSERIETRRTLQQVAERAGVSPQYLSEVERGRKDPSSEMLESICGALGLRLADLLLASGRTLRCAPATGQHPGAGQPSNGSGRPAGAVLLAA